jgi:hypothetical protein
MTVHLLGYCLECSAMYPSPVPTDGLCPICQAHEDRVYQNRPLPYDDVETKPWEFSKAAMRERLGVTGDSDE